MKLLSCWCFFFTRSDRLRLSHNLTPPNSSLHVFQSGNITAWTWNWKQLSMLSHTLRRACCRMSCSIVVCTLSDRMISAMKGQATTLSVVYKKMLRKNQVITNNSSFPHLKYSEQCKIDEFNELCCFKCFYMPCHPDSNFPWRQFHTRLGKINYVQH